MVSTRACTVSTCMCRLCRMEWAGASSFAHLTQKMSKYLIVFRGTLFQACLVQAMGASPGAQPQLLVDSCDQTEDRNLGKGCRAKRKMRKMQHKFQERNKQPLGLGFSSPCPG